MKILFLNKQKIYFLIVIIILLSISIVYYSFAKNNESIKYPYFTQENIYNNTTKIAYLTFDDGPNNKITPKVLEILDKTNIKANFFVIGSQVEKYPEITKRIYNNGHFIGNHSYSHNNRHIYQNKESFINEILKTDIAIGNAIGIYNFRSHVFRCPNGSMSKNNYNKKQKCLKILPEIDYTFVDWNVLNNDSIKKYSKKKLIDNLKKTSAHKGNIIILMHDSGDVNKTYDVLEDSINYLKNQGYEFRTFYDFIRRYNWNG